VPTDAAAVAVYVAGSAQKRISTNNNDNTGHTEWPDGRVHHTGFTTVLTPNTKVGCGTAGVRDECDYNSQQEGNSASVITYAAVTARSYHTNLVNVALMDGSVRSVSNSITLQNWRYLGTRSGGEVVGDY